MVFLILCGLMSLFAAVLVLSAVLVSGRAGRFEEDGAWWVKGDMEDNVEGYVGDEESN